MTKEQKNSQPVEAESKAESMQFPLESFLKKLKEDQRKKLRQIQRNDLCLIRNGVNGETPSLLFLVATAYSTYWIVKALIWLTR